MRKHTPLSHAYSPFQAAAVLVSEVPGSAGWLSNTSSGHRGKRWLASCRLHQRVGVTVLLSVDEIGLQPLPPGKAQDLEVALDELALMLGEQCDWMLTGGLAIAATIGHFYRNHDDLDLAVHQDELPRLVQAAQAHGYSFFRRLGATKVAPARRLTLFQQIQPQQASRNWAGRFHLLRLGERRWHLRPVALLDFIDVFPFHFEGEWAVSNGSTVRVLRALNRGSSYTTRSGRYVPLRGLAYLEQIKRWRTGEKDRFDLDMMKHNGLIG